MEHCNLPKVSFCPTSRLGAGAYLASPADLTERSLSSFCATCDHIKSIHVRCLSKVQEIELLDPQHENHHSVTTNKVVDLAKQVHRCMRLLGLNVQRVVQLCALVCTVREAQGVVDLLKEVGGRRCGGGDRLCSVIVGAVERLVDLLEQVCGRRRGGRDLLGSRLVGMEKGVDVTEKIDSWGREFRLNFWFRSSGSDLRLDNLNALATGHSGSVHWRGGLSETRGWHDGVYGNSGVALDGWYTEGLVAGNGFSDCIVNLLKEQGRCVRSGLDF
ncbi:hypothetical protein EJ05DRAFT_283139 [Pseudovirgaria hyperparasitica]|uniref:Uncharacterized protein n=1 Tax=Pseudovirgaria hyperparasitica TaxID=470096 RepID=A0A6A6WCF3_9PEZI|nr:uncharacterized protein EJ05DRAFT_283139 [Pseudovirgaria hyperparasitica]KAF2760393.1 hypothetical protein EJ05DRAFT_283139 [Pseudovirgaria hyperparasitica]